MKLKYSYSLKRKNNNSTLVLLGSPLDLTLYGYRYAIDGEDGKMVHRLI